MDNAEPIDIMIDFETLGQMKKGNLPYLLSFAAVAFNPHKPDMINNPNNFFVRHFSARDQENKGMHIQPATLNWWLSPLSKVPTQTFISLLNAGWGKEAITIEQFCGDFASFALHRAGFDKHRSHIWARGTDFDVTILNALFSYNTSEQFWKYTNVADVRTMLKAAGLTATRVPGQEHDALNDCLNQVADVQKANIIIKEMLGLRSK